MKIFAKSINNLTDARYFAAMGVDFLGFELSPDHPQFVKKSFVKQVRDWVEGPQSIACAGGLDISHDLLKNIEEQAFDGMSLELFTSFDKNNAGSDFMLFKEIKAGMDFDHSKYDYLIINLNEFDGPSSFLSFVSAQQIPSEKIFLDGDFDSSILNSTLKNKISGLVLRGGEEEKTGFKSFDELDEIFDLIHADNFN